MGLFLENPLVFLVFKGILLFCEFCCFDGVKRILEFSALFRFLSLGILEFSALLTFLSLGILEFLVVFGVFCGFSWLCKAGWSDFTYSACAKKTNAISKQIVFPM